MAFEGRIINPDIDQTLSGGLVNAHLTIYNRELNLGIPARVIANADSLFTSVFKVPQIERFRKLGPAFEDEFQLVREQIRTSPEVHFNYPVIDGAVAGIGTLLDGNNTFGKYYTVRKPQVRDATIQWLETNGFPYPERVEICENPKDKLERMIADYRATRKRVVLVDDGADELLKSARTLMPNRNARNVFRRMTLVAFGTPANVELQGTIDLETGLHVMHLQSWRKDKVTSLSHQLKINK